MSSINNQCGTQNGSFWGQILFTMGIHGESWPFRMAVLIRRGVRKVGQFFFVLHEFRAITLAYPKFLSFVCLFVCLLNV